MAVTFQKQSDLEGQLFIKISEADYKESYTKRLAEQSKKINVKGFRAGKVPTSVLEKMAGPKILSEEVFGLLEINLSKFIAENKLTLVGRPLPAASEVDKKIDFSSQREFNFTYDIATVPDFEVSVSKKLSFNNYKLVADGDKIKEVHESMIKRFGTHEQMETIGSGDLVKGNVKALDSLEDKSVNLWTEKLSATQQQAFIGKGIKEVITFDINELFDSNATLIAQFFAISKEEAAKLSGVYEFEIISITKYTDAEVNQEYYDKVFGPNTVTSDEQYKSEISKNVTSGYAPNVEYLLFKEMRDELLKETKISISESFLKRWILEANQEATLEAIEKDLQKYVDEYKWSLIRNKIISDNNLVASYEEVKIDAFNKVVRQYLGGNEVTEEMKETFNSFIDKYLREEKGKNYYNHYDSVLASKVIDFLKENVSLTEKEVSTAEFEAIVEKSI